MCSVSHSSHHVGLTSLAFPIEVGVFFSSALLKVLRTYLYVGLAFQQVGCIAADIQRACSKWQGVLRIYTAFSVRASIQLLHLQFALIKPRRPRPDYFILRKSTLPIHFTSFP